MEKGLPKEEELQFPQDYYQYDKEGMKAILDDFPNQVRASINLGNAIEITKSKNIFWFGMGGSAISGMLLKCYIGDSVQMGIVNDYDFPKHIPEDALLIFCSYSGNTEETLSCYKTAARKYKNVFSISSGGKLQEIAGMNRLQHMKIPKGIQPRNSIPYQVFPVLRILENAGIIANVDQEIMKFIDKIDMKQFAKHGAELALKLKNKIPIVYASHRYYPVAYRLKCEINENAKVHAFSHEFPELNHNEILGYTMLKGNFYGVILRFDDDHRRTQKRMELMKGIMKRSGVEVTELALKGPMINKMFSAILIGDYASYYLALAYKIDPSPVNLIEKFKKDMGPYV
ncbi:MAG: bifunctional phosphoglucose/phosphomannose isomerase [Nanoarchaeota archaeon]|nr:bifunctional phosphoglucose/phosphomannose isomerase [Nanoarchaeota archaeon]